MFLSNGLPLNVPMHPLELTRKQRVLVAISNYAPPSLRVRRVAKGQRENVTYVRTYYYLNSRLNRPESVSLASLARQLRYLILVHVHLLDVDLYN